MICLVYPGKSPKSKSSTQGPPGSGNVLCCEVCGKYGLPQDFSASGRFCSLSCVGAYTGRRNKGREFVRHIKTIDGKIIKRKKKKGKKMEKLGDLGETGVSQLELSCYTGLISYMY